MRPKFVNVMFCSLVIQLFETCLKLRYCMVNMTVIFKLEMSWVHFSSYQVAVTRKEPMKVGKYGEGGLEKVGGGIHQ